MKEREFNKLSHTIYECQLCVATHNWHYVL